MILPDVNVLIYAHRGDSERHEDYARWWQEVVGGGEQIALHDPVLSEFVRIVTNPRVFANPTSIDTALDFVERLRRVNGARWLPTGHRTWETLGRFAEGDRALRGNLVPDAHLAAVTIAHGCRLATTDRGFARFPGLRWFHPLSSGGS